MRFASRLVVAFGLALVAACGRVDYALMSQPDAGVGDSGSSSGDAGATPSDAGVTSSDAGVTSSDAGVMPSDAGVTPGDAGPCTAATFNGHDYVYCDAPVTFADAVTECSALGMHLVRIDDTAEQVFLEGFRVSASVWIGGTDQALEGDWRWQDGTAFYLDAMSGGMPVGGAYVHWGAAEPNGAARENCSQVSARGFWIDYPCDLVGAVLCERP